MSELVHGATLINSKVWSETCNRNDCSKDNDVKKEGRVFTLPAVSHCRCFSLSETQAPRVCL